MTELLTFEVDVKNMTEKGRGGGGDQLGFGVLIRRGPSHSAISVIFF